jgi:hypothetical protein
MFTLLIVTVKGTSSEVTSRSRPQWIFITHLLAVQPGTEGTDPSYFSCFHFLVKLVYLIVTAPKII